MISDTDGVQIYTEKCQKSEFFFNFEIYFDANNYIYPIINYIIY